MAKSEKMKEYKHKKRGDIINVTIDRLGFYHFKEAGKKGMTVLNKHSFKYKYEKVK